MTTKRKPDEDGSENLLAACIELKEKIEKKLKSNRLRPEDRDKYEKSLRATKRNIRQAKRLI